MLKIALHPEPNYTATYPLEVPPQRLATQISAATGRLYALQSLSTVIDPVGTDFMLLQSLSSDIYPCRHHVKSAAGPASLWV